MDQPLISIEIRESLEPDGVGVSILWADTPDISSVRHQEWEHFDKCWKIVCDGIHGLLAELGPIPENGWDVTIRGDHNKIKLP